MQLFKYSFVRKKMRLSVVYEIFTLPTETEKRREVYRRCGYKSIDMHIRVSSLTQYSRVYCKIFSTITLFLRVITRLTNTNNFSSAIASTDLSLDMRDWLIIRGLGSKLDNVRFYEYHRRNHISPSSIRYVSRMNKLL